MLPCVVLLMPSLRTLYVQHGRPLVPLQDKHNTTKAMLCERRYYPAPVIESIWPATLPRYGSYPAWIILQDGLAAVLNTTVRPPDELACSRDDALLPLQVH